MEVLNNIFVIAGIVLSGLFVFMLLVIIHELGHFRAAKKSGVKVLEFGIGIPPKACKLWTDKSGTEYTLNWIPLGGFVRLKGEDPKNPEEFNAKDSLVKAPIHKKIIVMLAGITVNLIFARLLFTAIFTVGTKPIFIVPENIIEVKNTSLITPSISYLVEKGFISGDNKNLEVIVDSVVDNMLGASLGIQTGDIIVKINDTTINKLNINKTLQENIGKDFQLNINRNNELLTKEGKCPENECLLGISILSSGNITIKVPFRQAIVLGLHELKAQSQISLYSLGKIGKGIASLDKDKMKESVDKLSGPVLITSVIGNLFLQREWTNLLGLMGLISFALALFNILPIPALDGGRTVSAIIQWIGRFKAEKYFNIEGYVNLVFFIILLLLGVYVMINDAIKIS